MGRVYHSKADREYRVTSSRVKRKVSSPAKKVCRGVDKNTNIFFKVFFFFGEPPSGNFRLVGSTGFL